MPLTVANVSVTPEARDFCASHDLASCLTHALDHVLGAFPDALAASVELEKDQEADYRWLKIDFVLSGALATVHTRYMDCARRLTRALGLPAATLIRANYTIARQP